MKIMKKLLLSICIPTYNRAKYLKNSIDSIICQKEFLDGYVEIIISDNASTDETEELVRDYIEKFNNVLYYKNEKNIRDRNFPLALSRGRGLYRRLCNDTLIFKDSALEECCKIIKENIEEKPFIVWTNDALNQNMNLMKTDFKGYVHNVSYWITSIACFGLWAEECKQIENDVAGAELYLWQVRKALESAKKKNNVLICNKGLTETQFVEGKNISYGIFQVFYENYFELLDPYFKEKSLDENEKNYLERDLLFNFFMTWCIQWELQNTNLQYSRSENLKKLIYDQYRDKSYWKEYETLYKKSLRRIKIKKIIKKMIGREP